MTGFCDEYVTAGELAGRRPAFAILPVGAHEQHAAHLPLASDSITARAYCERVARRLGGWLLPTVPYGTSYEQLGFPGTVTLRWRTLAAVVEDVITSCWKQDVKMVFVLSGHGGNFILNPCVRELNSLFAPDRLDGCKAVLIPESPAPSAGATNGHGQLDELHAGRIETSVIMALEPALVKPEMSVDAVPDAQRAELTNRTIKELSPNGVWGRPTQATLEEGERRVAERTEQLCTYVQGWLRTLDQA